jgi:hypothetical protein
MHSKFLQKLLILASSFSNLPQRKRLARYHVSGPMDIAQD